MKNELGNALDELNRAIEKVEISIAALELGVGGVVTMLDEEGDKHALSWKKMGDRWRLALDHEPLTSAPRYFRVQAVNHLAELVEHMKTFAKSEVSEAKRAVDRALSFATTLKPDLERPMVIDGLISKVQNIPDLHHEGGTTNIAIAIDTKLPDLDHMLSLSTGRVRITIERRR